MKTCVDQEKKQLFSHENLVNAKFPLRMTFAISSERFKGAMQFYRPGLLPHLRIKIPLPYHLLRPASF